ncbi:hypothetical protein PA27867_3693 [Cryobacterium arcticum]|uniref:Uncharacterized protein n=1 Tax=Cryobacterium arcticum TaxID=670052 RepID=A0A1B1BPL2_9MICO|nr:hypothetical protein PA27867_3693 [Cryobacterium arcticum]
MRPVSDPSLRLPNTQFCAVLNLGVLPLVAPPLPPRFAYPVLDAQWLEDGAAVYIGFEEGELHFDVTERGIEHHFHNADGVDSDISPWPRADTAKLLAWAVPFVNHVSELLEELTMDAAEAAEWSALGLTVYATSPEEPVQLEVVDLELEGEQLMLPWLGAGHVGHDHIDGPNHPIALLWNAEHDEPDLPLASAWTDPTSGQPAVLARPGVDWDAVGLPEAEVLEWLEGLYLNHHLLADPEELILRAGLERIAGIR